MRFDIITLFPQLLMPFMEHGINRRAMRSNGGSVDVQFWNPRDFADGQYRRVDDRPFGGGPGMVMLAEPLQRCLCAIRQARGDANVQAPLIYFSPAGQAMTHGLIHDWAADEVGAILLCGRYEGVDQRFIDQYVDVQISLGDFVLSGGEIAAAAFLDSLLRLQPGVLNDEQSHQQDSFNPVLSGLLDCPQYTRPEIWNDELVPAALRSGNHALIAQWRREQSLHATAKNRPDLLQKAHQEGLLGEQDQKYLKKINAAL